MLLTASSVHEPIESLAMTEPARSWMRVDGIDLLRGLAICLVLLNHVNMQLLFAAVPFTRGWPPQLVYSLVWNGQQGVQIFFAVSGFLITATTLRRWGSPGAVNPRPFYLLRIARIAPLLLLLLLVLSLLDLVGATHFIVSAKTGGLGRALLAALTFHINLLEARRGYLPGSWDILWSLSVEEMFYLGFPLLCRLLGRSKLLIAILCSLVFLGPFARTVFSQGNEVWREYSYLGGMDAIALGCLTALLPWRPGKRQLRLLVALGVALLLFALGWSLQAYRLGLGRSGLYMTLVAVGTCLLMLAAAQTQWRSPQVLAPLRRLGQRSYEIYLTHIFVVLACFSIFRAVGKPLAMVPVLFVAVIIGAGILGELVGRLYSEPANRLLRRRWGGGRLGSGLEPVSPKPITTAAK